MRAFASLRQDADRRPEALWFLPRPPRVPSTRDFENAAIAMKQLGTNIEPHRSFPRRDIGTRVEESKGGAAEARRAEEMQRAPLTYGLLARPTSRRKAKTPPLPPRKSRSSPPTRRIIYALKAAPILIDRSSCYHEAGLDDYAREDAAAAPRRFFGASTRGSATLCSIS